MYKDCVKCSKIGVSCDGPNLFALPASELVAWCRSRKEHLGLSNQRIADLANISKGTVDGFFASAHADFRYETIRPILKSLIGGEWSGDACPDPTSEERAAYEEKIRQLEAAIEWRDDKIKHLLEGEKFLKGTIKTLKKALITVSTLLGLAMVLIIAALIVDRLNGDMGFFWLDGHLFPHGITQIIQQWRT